MINYKLINKKVKVVLKDNQIVVGIFIDEYEEEKTIGIQKNGGIIEIPENEIKEMTKFIEDTK